MATPEVSLSNMIVSTSETSKAKCVGLKCMFVLPVESHIASTMTSKISFK